jgi:DnaJ-class molecular chaperone
MRSEEAQKKPGDEVPASTPQAAENICRRCGGTGQLDGQPCAECAGEGTVITTVGDA